MKFIKMHGAGNDFVMLDLVNSENRPDGLSEIAATLCNRHKGVGSDGLITVSRGSSAPFRMDMLNPDGSDGGMCGNGVRCAARLLVEEGHQPLEAFGLEVGRRIVRVEPLAINSIRVDMGFAFLERGEIGILGDPVSTFIGQEVAVRGVNYLGTAISMGNPHLVIFCDDPDDVPLQTIGPLIEHHELFPNRTNVHFASRVGPEHLKMRTWERGAGLTLACGSGACSVGVAGFLNNYSERRVSVAVPGGTLSIEYREDGGVTMQGPAERVFEGSWPIGDEAYAALLR